MSKYSIWAGDVETRLVNVTSNTFHGVFCDPPYGIGFMNKGWDRDVVPVSTWRELLRVCRPGALMLVFGGTRTFHRQAVNIEDAGWLIRDTVLCPWFYGSGFPKSHNISLAIDKAAGAQREVVGSRTLTGNAGMSAADKGGTYGVQVGSAGNVEVPVTAPATDAAKLWDGYGTALKPAWEPVTLAMKPLEGTFAQNAVKWGTGGINVAGARVGDSGGTAKAAVDRGSKSINSFGNNLNGGVVSPIDAGRFPANLILDDVTSAELDAATTHRKGRGATKATRRALPDSAVDIAARTVGETFQLAPTPERTSEFFYRTKVGTKERHAGTTSPNRHPTLKPLDLCRYLATMILPPGGDATLLVPFAGSGSEMIGALMAGWSSVTGIELSPEHVATAHERIAHHTQATVIE